jgi:hypothetical protein
MPQGSVLGLVLYLIYTSDLLQPEGTTVVTFVNDTIIMTVGDDVEEATENCKGQLTK